MNWKTINEVRKVRDIINESDIIHLHNGGNILPSILSKISHNKVIRHFHGSDVRIRLHKRNYSSIIKMFYRLLGQDGTVVGTPDLIQLLPRDLAKNAECIPPPLDPMIERGASNKTSEAIIFLPTRHDEFLKKTSVAFKAWDILKKENREAHLVTICWGKDYDLFRRTYKNDDRITWLGVLNRKEYLETLSKASVVWGQFELGQLGFVELEAIFSEKPFFSFVDNALTGLPSTRFTNASSPQRIAKETNKLLSGSINIEDISKLKVWVNERYGAKSIADKYMNYYSRLTNG